MVADATKSNIYRYLTIQSKTGHVKKRGWAGGRREVAGGARRAARLGRSSCLDARCAGEAGDRTDVRTATAGDSSPAITSETWLGGRAEGGGWRSAASGEAGAKLLP